MSQCELPKADTLLLPGPEVSNRRLVRRHTYPLRNEVRSKADTLLLPGPEVSDRRLVRRHTYPLRNDVRSKADTLSRLQPGLQKGCAAMHSSRPCGLLVADTKPVHAASDCSCNDHSKAMKSSPRNGVRSDPARSVRSSDQKTPFREPQEMHNNPAVISVPMIQPFLALPSLPGTADQQDAPCPCANRSVNMVHSTVSIQHEVIS